MSIEFNSLGSIKFKGASNHTLTLATPSMNFNRDIVLGVYEVSDPIIDNDIVLSTESGSIIPLDSSAQAITVDLPTAIKGLCYKFVISDTANNNAEIQAHAGDRIDGYLLSGAGHVACVNATSITFSTLFNNPLVGDSIDFVCLENGKWTVLGFTQEGTIFVVA